MLRRIMLAGLLTMGVVGGAHAQLSDNVVKIGVLNDMGGPYADFAGPGSVDAVRMAVEDFGGSVLGKPIEVVVADHQNIV
jgi:branched-chain amino acid transport system substrate-binding protein